MPLLYEQCDLDRFTIVNVELANPLLRVGFGGLLVILEVVVTGLLEVAVQQLKERSI